MPRRDWSLVNRLRAGAVCVVCGSGHVQAAHIIGRSRDGDVVAPDEIAWLCPSHHLAYDAHTLDLFPHLAPSQLSGAVRAAGTPGMALRRLSGPLWRSGSRADLQLLDQRLVDLETIHQQRLR